MLNKLIFHFLFCTILLQQSNQMCNGQLLHGLSLNYANYQFLFFSWCMLFRFTDNRVLHTSVYRWNLHRAIFTLHPHFICIALLKWHQQQKLRGLIKNILSSFWFCACVVERCISSLIIQGIYPSSHLPNPPREMFAGPSPHTQPDLHLNTLLCNS